MSGHEIVGMFPAWKGFDGVEPHCNVLVLGGDVEAEFLRRIVEVAGQRQIGDARPRAEQERPARKALVDNAEVVVDAALEKSEHGRIARRFGETPQETIRPQKPLYLFITQHNPPPPPT